VDYVDPRSLEFGTNAESMRVLVAELREMLDSVAGGGEASRARHTSRGKMLARQIGTMTAMARTGPRGDVRCTSALGG
jgi:hypothetical protein